MRVLSWVVALVVAGCDGLVEELGGADSGAEPHDAGAAGATVTLTWQQDSNGYSGTRSIGISTYGGLGAVGQYNANGMTFGDGDNDWCIGLAIPGGPYDEVWLVRFEELTVPAGATVVSATLSMTATHFENAQVAIEGRYLDQPWKADMQCAGCTAATGWRYRDGPSVPWSGLGASGSSDVLVGKTFRVPTMGFLPSSMRTTIKGELDPEVVQRWLSGANFGVRLVPTVSGVHVGFIQPQRHGVMANLKPRLTITYRN